MDESEKNILSTNLENRNGELKQRKIAKDNESISAIDLAKDEVENIAQKVWEVMHHNHLPDWLRDNEYLHFGHRPPMPSYLECYKSIFRLHTQTGNIWSHMLGMIIFIGLALHFFTRPSNEIRFSDKLACLPFFTGAIGCLGFSFTYHTVHCHSESVARFFHKMDYVGIILLIVGSFVPWLHYGFYCRPIPKFLYMIIIFVFGGICLIMTLSDKFATPKYRPVRAGMFSALGLFGVIPFVHFYITDGYHTSLIWLVIMANTYLFGAFLYGARIPERFCPGKCDYWCQSHQLFHLCVVAAALVHYYGIKKMVRLRFGGEWSC